MKKTMNNDITSVTVIPSPTDIKANIATSLVKTAPSCSGVKYSIVPIDLMELPFYQRAEQAMVSKIASEWSDTLCGVISLSWRDSKLWIVDGQNRVAAAKLVGKTELICTIATGLSEQDEFWYFANQNKNVVKVSAYDIVTGGARIGTEPFTSIVNTLNDMRFDFKPRGFKGDGAIVAMDAVLNIWKSSGREGLIWILRTISECNWKDAPLGCSAPVLKALNTVFCRYYKDRKLAREAIARAFGKTNPMMIVARGLIESGSMYRGNEAILRTAMCKAIEEARVPQLS